MSTKKTGRDSIITKKYHGTALPKISIIDIGNASRGIAQLITEISSEYATDFTDREVHRPALRDRKSITSL